jgi:hypothetical protein
MKSSPGFAKLVNTKELHTSVHFPLNPGDHSREKMRGELRRRLGLFYRESFCPWEIRRAVCHSEKPLPTARKGATSELVNEPSHPISKAKPARTGGTVFAPSPGATGLTAAEVAAHAGTFADRGKKSLVRIEKVETRSRS